MPEGLILESGERRREHVSVIEWIKRHRNVISFWFLGLANNYGYVVMLSAAHDILANFDHEDHQGKEDYVRECNTMGTGIILLADITPSILIKIVSPFLPLWIKIRVLTAILLSIAGFLLVAARTHKLLIIFGVVCTSLACGLGESSLLSYVVFFKTKNVISTWSSGTGGAGIFGSMSYATLTAIGLSPMATLLIMVVVPISEAFIFFFCLDHPKIEARRSEEDKSIPTEADTLKFKEKMRIVPKLLVVYMIPFGLVFFLEYTINQGLFELLYFPYTFLDHSEQYRWYSVLYQIGVFLSRSSMNIVHFQHIWLLALLQFVNFVLCLLEVFFGFMGYLPILMVVIFWEGIVGGASYVNTYRRIATEMPPETRQFSMAMNSFADVIMITSAGLISYPVHNIICSKVPSPYQA